MLKTFSLSAPDPVSCADPSWKNSGLAGVRLAMTGSIVACLVPEFDQGAVLNGDGDRLDRVASLYDASTATVIPIGLAAEDFVLGDDFLRFARARRDKGANH